MARNCSECKEKRAAHILCTYCNRWLCSSCTEEHRHGPAPGGPVFPRTQKGSPGVNGGSGDFALYCPLHKQEVLKLFCETCDVLTCHSCLMVEHKEHRCRHLEEVLQNQRMLLESVTTQVAHKKSSLQTSAKQIEDRIFEVKHQHRKVENQIKMAKMVLMNELNKQANGLLEELESIMVLNRQFEHVQNFINWAVCSKTSIPFLFSKELIVFQMQRLLETNCNTDPGSPWSIRFTWEPNFWTKQLASLDTPAYGSLQGPSSFYQSHQSPGAQQETLSRPSHRFQSPALCSSSVCCSHCSPVSPSLKGQVPPPSIHPAHSFRQPSEMVPQQLRSLQCSPLLPREKELPCRPHPPKLLQPWLETQPPAEQESTSQRLGQQLTSQPVCIVPPQDVQQGAHAPPAFQTPSVQHLASSQHESPPGPACSQNVDIMHHKFELEEMQKDLELLLQAQQPSLQLSQTKSPQHLQQTIVGQINYIVRQPAPVQSQSQEDTVQATDESPASEGPKPILPLDKNTAANLPQASGEETPHSVPPLDSAIQHSSPNVVRKVLTEPAIADHTGPTASQDPRDLDEDDWGYPAEVAEHLGALGSLGDKLLEPFLSIYLPAGGSVHGNNPESHDSSAVLLSPLPFIPTLVILLAGTSVLCHAFPSALHFCSSTQYRGKEPVLACECQGTSEVYLRPQTRGTCGSRHCSVCSTGTYSCSELLCVTTWRTFVTAEQLCTTNNRGEDKKLHLEMCHDALETQPAFLALKVGPPLAPTHLVAGLQSDAGGAGVDLNKAHSTSVSVMGFSNTLEMELSSTRLARTLEPQIQSASSLTAAPPQVVPSLLSGPPPTVSSLVGGQNQAMPSLTASHLPTMPSLVRGTPHSMPSLTSDPSQAITSLASDHSQTGPNLMSGPTHTVPSLAACPLQSMPPASNMQSETGSSCSPGSGRTSGSLCPGDGADPSLGNALCKMENEDSTRFTDSLGQGPTAPGPDTSKDLAIPSELEEPINLSVKKPALVPVVNKSVALQQYQSP
ncbi:hypothetical protein E2I00_012324, partial [Balaenoptera physalus]